jgi:hypothetical protein
MILKPMNAGEILDNTFKLFKGQFKSYLGIVVLGIASFIVLGLIVGALYYMFGKTTVMVGGAIAYILFIVVNLAMNAGLIKMTSEQILDRKMGSMEAYRFGFGKAWYLFLGGLLYVIIVTLSAILLIIPGVYFGNALVLFSQSIVIEEKGPWSALKRSKLLTKGSWWRCFGIIFLAIVFMVIISTLPRMVIGIFVGLIFNPNFIATIIDAFLGIIISTLFAPLIMIAMTLLYYDLRIRKENLDLQVMVGNLTDKSNMNQ